MSTIRVLPIVDLNTGRLQFRLHGQWVVYYTDRPRELLRVLARSTAPASFAPETNRLVLTVAGRRTSHGSRVAFSLAKFPDPFALTTLDGDGRTPDESADAPYRV